MKNPMALAVAVVTALVAAASRAAARRPRRQAVPSTEPAPVTVTAGHSQPRPTVTGGTHDRAVRRQAGPPRSPARPARAVEQAQQIFHELHAAGRNTLCAVCDSQYEPA
jgi:hypothetical protein